MIKARAGNVVLLGLEPRNIELLKKGNPIMVRLSELGVPNCDVVVAIMYGDTQEAIVAKIEAATGLKVPVIEPVT
jgi:predicted transcriptional regulator